MSAQTQDRFAFAGALLMALGMAYGLVVVAVMTGASKGDPHMTLGAHLNALFGAIWLWGVGWCAPRCRLGPVGMKVMVTATIVGAYVNWLLSVAKAVPGKPAITLTGDSTNDVLFVLRGVFVVVPSLLGPSLLVWGLRPKRAS
jgi:hypothetical protein